MLPVHSLQQSLALCDPTVCSPQGSSVHGILQAGLLEGVTMPSSRRSTQSRDRTGFFLHLLHCTWILYCCSTQQAIWYTHAAKFKNNFLKASCFKRCLSNHALQDPSSSPKRIQCYFLVHVLPVWANSGRWWRTGKPGVLQSMGSQKLRQGWTTEQKQQKSFQRYFKHIQANMFMYRYTHTKNTVHSYIFCFFNILENFLYQYTKSLP